MSRLTEGESERRQGPDATARQQRAIEPSSWVGTYYHKLITSCLHASRMTATRTQAKDWMSARVQTMKEMCATPEGSAVLSHMRFDTNFGSTSGCHGVRPHLHDVGAVQAIPRSPADNLCWVHKVIEQSILYLHVHRACSESCLLCKVGVSGLAKGHPDLEHDREQAQTQPDAWSSIWSAKKRWPCICR